MDYITFSSLTGKTKPTLSGPSSYECGDVITPFSNSDNFIYDQNIDG